LEFAAVSILTIQNVPEQVILPQQKMKNFKKGPKVCFSIGSKFIYLSPSAWITLWQMEK
jgi:hypothetical protein